MSRLVEEVLNTWRDAERLLGELAPVDPDHETIELSVVALRDVYSRLTADRELSDEALAASQETLAVSRRVLEATRLRATSTRDGPQAAQTAAASPQ